MSKPIILHSRTRSARTSDDSGTTIIKSIITNCVISVGAYEHNPLASPRHSVPGLAYFCVRALVETPELVHALGSFRLSCSSQRVRNVLRQLIRHRGRWEDVDWSQVDPRLWAVIVQVFSDLPFSSRTYPHLALSDRHLPLLLEIPSTSHFSFITVLSLASHPELDDNNIAQLKPLSSLCYLNLSFTSVSSHGVQRFSRTLDLDTRQGPWALRVIRLTSCRLTSDVLTSLSVFPLLSLVDLTSTNCRQTAQHSLLGFKPCPYARLYHGNDAVSILRDLASLTSTMTDEVEVSSFYSSSSPYSLNIDKLCYPNNPHLARPHLAPVRRDDQYVVFSPAAMKTGVVKPDPAFLDDQQRERRLENQERASREAEHHAVYQFEDWCSEHEDSEKEEEEPDADSVTLAPVSFHPVGNVPAFAPASVFYPKPEKKRKGTQQFSPAGPLTTDAATANPSVLFRPPPPWSHLSEHISALLIANAARQLPPSTQPSVFGPSTAGRRAAASDVAGVLAQIGKRRRVDDPPVFGGGGASVPATASRNPFRRQSMPGPGLLPASDLHMLVAGPSKPTRMKPRASLPGPVFVSDFAPDMEASDSGATSAVPSSPPPLGKSILKAVPQPQRPLKPITALPIPILPIPDNKRRVKVLAPRPKSMNQAQLDLQAGFAKPPPVAASADMEKPVMKLPDAGLTKKRPRVDSAPNPPPVVPKPPAQRKTLKPPNKSLSVKQAPAAPGPTKGKAVSNPKSKDAFNWTGWSKNLS